VTLPELEWELREAQIDYDVAMGFGDDEEIEEAHCALADARRCMSAHQQHWIDTAYHPERVASQPPMSYGYPPLPEREHLARFDPWSL
jgi:hypothetical protein